MPPQEANVTAKVSYNEEDKRVTVAIEVHGFGGNVNKAVINADSVEGLAELVRLVGLVVREGS